MGSGLSKTRPRAELWFGESHKIVYSSMGTTRSIEETNGHENVTNQRQDCHMIYRTPACAVTFALQIDADDRIDLNEVPEMEDLDVHTDTDASVDLDEVPEMEDLEEDDPDHAVLANAVVLDDTQPGTWYYAQPGIGRRWPPRRPRLVIGYPALEVNTVTVSNWLACTEVGRDISVSVR